MTVYVDIYVSHDSVDTAKFEDAKNCRSLSSQSACRTSPGAINVERTCNGSLIKCERVNRSCGRDRL